MPIMSQKAYARHRGMSFPAVQKAIASGRISTTATGLIDSEVADEEWKRNTRTRATAAAERDAGEDGDVFGAAQYNKARAVREHYQARLAKLEYEQKVGSLVSRDEVKIAAFNTLRQFRDAMLNIPDRLAAMLAAETEAARCYEILATEIRKALNDFADSGPNG